MQQARQSSMLSLCLSRRQRMTCRRVGRVGFQGGTHRHDVRLGIGRLDEREPRPQCFQLRMVGLGSRQGLDRRRRAFRIALIQQSRR